MPHQVEAREVKHWDFESGDHHGCERAWQSYAFTGEFIVEALTASS